MRPAVAYPLLVTAFLIFFVISRDQHVAGGHRRNRRLAHNYPGFDLLMEQFNSSIREGESDPAFHENVDVPVGGDIGPDPFGGKYDHTEEYFNDEGQLNVTERLIYLYPLIDKWPEDGGISSNELEFWNTRQVIDRMMLKTSKEMKARDKDRDGALSLGECLSHLSHQEIELNGTAPGQAWWWIQRFMNADADDNGLLNFSEFRDFLNPEDSGNEKIKQWLLEDKIREVDDDGDGKLNYAEFRDHAYEIYVEEYELEQDYVEGNTQDLVLGPEEYFAKLDANNDKYLDVDELKPIFRLLCPGHLSNASYYTKYLIHEVDDDKDGKLSLNEILEHENTFYSTIYDENEDDHHDELR